MCLSAAKSRKRITNVCWSHDAMGTARGVPMHPAKALNRKNATSVRAARFSLGFLPWPDTIADAVRPQRNALSFLWLFTKEKRVKWPDGSKFCEIIPPSGLSGIIRCLCEFHVSRVEFGRECILLPLSQSRHLRRSYSRGRKQRACVRPSRSCSVM